MNCLRFLVFSCSYLSISFQRHLCQISHSRLAVVYFQGLKYLFCAFLVLGLVTRDLTLFWCFCLVGELAFFFLFSSYFFAPRFWHLDCIPWRASSLVMSIGASKCRLCLNVYSFSLELGHLLLWFYWRDLHTVSVCLGLLFYPMQAWVWSCHCFPKFWNTVITRVYFLVCIDI